MTAAVARGVSSIPTGTAEEGFAVDDVLARNIAKNEGAYRRWDCNAAIFLPGGGPPAVGAGGLERDRRRAERPEA